MKGRGTVPRIRRVGHPMTSLGPDRGRVSVYVGRDTVTVEVLDLSSLSFKKPGDRVAFPHCVVRCELSIEQAIELQLALREAVGFANQLKDNL